MRFLSAFFVFVFSFSLLSACAPQTVVDEAEVNRRVELTVQAIRDEWTQTAPVALSPLPLTNTPTLASTDTPTAQPLQSATPLPTLGPDDWKGMPVLPSRLSERVRQIYALGQLSGNNPNAFSKVGDCHSTMPGYLGDFDNPTRYKLGDYDYLQPTIDYFKGSYGRQSRAVKNGLTASASLVALWNDWQDCTQSETPLDCEYRIQKPAFALIAFGTNDVMGFAPFETTLRRVIDTTIGHNIVPILITKPDNAERDFSANRTIVQLAYEYDIPLINSWAALQPLPEHGLRSPEHLSQGDYTYTGDLTSESLQYGMNMRNLNVLQGLDIVRRLILNQPLP